MMDREDILARHRARKDARLALTSEAKQARETWRPANVMGRWKTKQVEKISAAKDKSLKLAKDNKTAIGATALAAVLIAARRPLIATAKRLNDRLRNG